jgi:hypothetical protein
MFRSSSVVGHSGKYMYNPGCGRDSYWDGIKAITLKHIKGQTKFDLA